MSSHQTALLAGILTCFVARAGTVQAEEAAPHPASGTWSLATPQAELRTTLAAAVDEVAGEFSFVIREIARAKLEGATKVCARYTIDVQPTTVRFGCDANPPAVLSRDGTPLHTTNEAGEPIAGTVRTTADGVVVTWKGAVGARTNTFTVSGDQLQLRATVTGERLPKPLAWSVAYRR